MSIFISIASYRDPELMRTINSAIENADNPDELVFGLVIQDFIEDIPDFVELPNMRIIKMHPKQAQGAGYARAKAMELYNGEDYFLQIDSHSRFTKGWDTLCFDQYKKAQEVAQNDKIILSHFPLPYHIDGRNKVTYPQKDKVKVSRPTNQWPFLHHKNGWTARREEQSNTGMPELAATVLAGFMFAKGDIVKEVPYDPAISFFGEEICFAVRAWTRGWDIYSPCVVILYHFYSREGYKKIWKDRNLRGLSWKELEERSKEKQRQVLCGIEDGIFGVGKERSLWEYERMCHINFRIIYGLTNSDYQSTIDIESER